MRMRKNLRRYGLALATGMLGAVATPAFGGEAPTSQPSDDLTSLSLEDLMKVQVTTVSKQKQSIGQAPAAVSVISQDDIQRSGLTSIPDLLRLAPGMDVARFNASAWAVGARGFNDVYNNKLLVLMDGRTVFSSTFGGVFWNAEDYVLQDLDRIEVVRGPGATLWGSTAVNGVIDVVYKDAKDTQGWLVTGIGGNQEQGGAIRFGGKIDDQTYFRVYTKYRNFEDQLEPSGRSAEDGWQSVQGGFRIDHLAGDDKLTVEGDLFGQQLSFSETRAVIGAPYMTVNNGTYGTDGGNILGRWTHTLSDTSNFSVQMYYDRFDRSELYVPLHQNQFDISFQHRFALTPRQEVIWGLEHRSVLDRLDARNGYAANPTARDLAFTSGFIQDDLTLVKDRLHFIVGTKLEYDPYINFQVQPGARVLWTPDGKNTVWGSISRALTTPARYQEDMNTVFAGVPSPTLPVTSGAVASRGLQPEELLQYELGYRVSPAKSLTVDLNRFYNDYDHLIGTQTMSPTFVATPTPHVFVPVRWTNNLEGESYGGEVAATWRVNDRWRLTGSYTLLRTHIRAEGPDNGVRAGFYRGTSPENQAQLHSYFNLLRNLQLNTAVYYVSPLAEGHVPANVRVDANIDWRIRDGLDLMVGVQNLFDDRHPEFPGTESYYVPTELPRTFFAQLTYRF
jgi:iron complex outermembrane receptor protein